MNHFAEHAPVDVAPPDSPYVVLAEHVLDGLAGPDVYRQSDILKETFGRYNPTELETVQFLGALTQREHVTPREFKEESYLCIVPNPESDDGKRYLSIGNDVEQLVTFLLEQFTSTPFDEETAYLTAQAYGWLPAGSNDLKKFKRLFFSHADIDLPADKYFSIKEAKAEFPHEAKPWRSSALPLRERLELFFTTQTTPFTVNIPWMMKKLGEHRDRLEPGLLKRALNESSHCARVLGYSLWEVVPEGSSREQLDAARQCAEATIDALQTSLVELYKAGRFLDGVVPACTAYARARGLEPDDQELFEGYVKAHHFWRAVKEGRQITPQEAILEARLQQRFRRS